MNEKPIDASSQIDLATWTQELFALNPWANALNVNQYHAFLQFFDDEQFRAARRKETLKRLKEGNVAWNIWAERMVGFRKRLEDAGDWSDGEHLVHRPRFFNAGLWRLLATADFSSDASKGTFGDADFSEFLFPGPTLFSSATFSRAWFRGTTFSGEANFRGTTFSNTADFSHAIFSNTADFSHAVLSGDAYFHNATFSGSAIFGNAIFSTAIFGHTTFSGEAKFDSAIFSGDAYFHGVTF